MKLALRDYADVVTALKGPVVIGSGSEKRNAARITVTAKIDAYLIENGKVGRTYSALTRDISLTGIGLLQSVVLPPQQEVILALPRDIGPLFVVSLALHCRNLADGLVAAGMEFVRLAEDSMGQSIKNNRNDEYARIQQAMMK